MDLIKIEISLRHALATGAIDEHIYHRSLIGLACRYLEKGLVSEAVVRVRWCSEQYLRDELPADMKSDANFRKMAYTLANDLVRVGVGSSVPQPLFSCPPGKA